MLRVSKLADYGTVVMAYLAQKPPGLSNARDIALHTHLGLATVSKLLKKLVLADLLVSERGQNGGYKLKKLAASISLAQIVRALDDELALTECGLTVSHCALQGVCGVQQNWQAINKIVLDALENVSLAKFCG
jgi:FeS assembly SUF system regulator